MLTFVLWCILFVLCWPLALLALVIYPIVWLILLPFRIVGIAVGGVLDLICAIVTLPARMLGARPEDHGEHDASRGGEIFIAGVRPPIRGSRTRQSRSCAG